MSIAAEPSSAPRATPPDLGGLGRAARPSDPAAAYLWVDDSKHRRAGRITSRVLIGRRPSNHIVIPDPAVARIHAWIIRNGDEHILCDTGNALGTLVNDRRVETRCALHPGDVIRIGPVTIRYTADPTAIAGAEPLDLSDRPIATTRPADGQFVDCACGAPLWVPWDFAGKMGQCRYCNQTVFVQTRLAVVASPLAPRPAPAGFGEPGRAAKLSDSPRNSAQASEGTVCGICQSAIDSGDQRHACPSCAIPFHADCWTENRGCSSYGCAQVNILAPESPPAPSPLLSEGELEADPSPPFPWEFLILAAAVIGAILGAWTFGLPPLAAAIAAAMGLRKPTQHRSVLLVALPLAVIGALAGIALSYFWWISSRQVGIHR